MGVPSPSWQDGQCRCEDGRLSVSLWWRREDFLTTMNFNEKRRRLAARTETAKRRSKTRRKCSCLVSFSSSLSSSEGEFCSHH